MQMIKTQHTKIHAFTWRACSLAHTYKTEYKDNELNEFTVWHSMSVINCVAELNGVCIRNVRITGISHRCESGLCCCFVSHRERTFVMIKKHMFNGSIDFEWWRVRVFHHFAFYELTQWVFQQIQSPILAIRISNANVLCISYNQLNTEW